MEELRKTNLRVAVVIPCHNHKSYILGALESVDEQDYPYKEIVVVDDASTDGLMEYLNTIVLKNGTPIHKIRNEQALGPSGARNVGIKYIINSSNSPDIIGVLDADDRYLSGKLSKSVPYIEKDPYFVGLVFSDLLIYDERTGRVVIEFKEPFDRSRLERECNISNAPLINKLALGLVGLYDEEMRTCEDWDLWLRITEKFVAIHIPEPLQLYNVTGFNASFTVPTEIWQKNWIRVQQKLRARCRNT